LVEIQYVFGDLVNIVSGHQVLLRVLTLEGFQVDEGKE
jgi:hypothetical protein